MGSKAKGKGKVSAESEALELLQTIAGSPIYRGHEYGVAGEVKAICAARSLLANVLHGRKTLADESWKTLIGEEVVKAAKDWPDETESCHYCPGCRGAI